MATKKVAVASVKSVSAKRISAVKKPVAKKVTTKKELVYATDKKSFWVSDGQILNSLVALRDAFDHMEKTVYAHHVTSEKNDFADWVAHVLHDETCAKDLFAAKTPAAAKTIVVRNLKLYAL